MRYQGCLAIRFPVEVLAWGAVYRVQGHAYAASPLLVLLPWAIATCYLGSFVKIFFLSPCFDKRGRKTAESWQWEWEWTGKQTAGQLATQWLQAAVASCIAAAVAASAWGNLAAIQQFVPHLQLHFINICHPISIHLHKISINHNWTQVERSSGGFSLRLWQFAMAVAPKLWTTFKHFTKS